jgi:hypothetical protein
MNEAPAAAPAEENAAWATIAVPLGKPALAAFAADVERLLRLNPYLEMASWQEEPGPFGPGKRYRGAWLNEMTGLRHEITLSVEAAGADGYTLAYDRGLKRATQVILAADGAAAGRLTLKEHYHAADGADREERLKEVDRSLVPWAAAIHDYLRGLARWAWFPPYRWYKAGFWLRMPPRQRRIARLIVWTTVLEFVVFLFVFVIYWLESRRG